MQFFIPELGKQFRLTREWSVPVQREHRNETVLEAMLDEQTMAQYGHHGYYYYHGDPVFHIIAFPAGTVLQVDRIYIRQGVKDFNSVTFRVVSSPDVRLMPPRKGGKAVSGGKGKRFWVKLQHVNGTEVQWADDTKFTKEELESPLRRQVAPDVSVISLLTGRAAL